MPFRSPADPATDSSRIGVLLTNVGSPAAPTSRALRPYLAEFLGDERVIEYPPWLWKPVLHGIILNSRPARSARLYERIWTEEGSPLLITMQRQAAALEARLAEQSSVPVTVVAGFRYGEPSIAAVLRQLDDAGIHRILALPLFPQYSATTTGTSLDAVFNELRAWRRVPELRTINSYFDNPRYIDVVAESVREQWRQTGAPQRLMISFHGIPHDYVVLGDPYFDQCHVTARLLAEALGLEKGDWLATFQSRFGPSEWLQPYTEDTLGEWGREGLSHVDVVCPGFSADCLETSDEVGHEGRRAFQEAGGGRFNYIPALNDRPDHIDLLADLIMQHLGGWLGLMDNQPGEHKPRDNHAHAV